MVPRRSLPTNPDDVLCVILGGGGGKGLFPLTRDRATPAVPLAGNYRLVDVPISNCINSGFQRIYILTQFNSASLHRHVALAYKFDQFSHGFVEIRAAQQTPTDCSWYQGTADAVRKNLGHFLSCGFSYALVLSADQLYRFDFRAMIAQHEQTGADITIATIPVSESEAGSLGIVQTNQDQQIIRFVEKPTVAERDSLKFENKGVDQNHSSSAGKAFLGSMGIYLFNRDVLRPLLDNSHPDFGKQILPGAVKTHRVFSYLFRSYWKDVGSIRAFFEANLGLVSDAPSFNFFELLSPIYSQPLYLPAAKIHKARLDQTLVSAGCVIEQASIQQGVLGLRTMIRSGSSLRRVITMGCDSYENEHAMGEGEDPDLPRIGIGRNAHIENAIIDRNARIGDDVVISPNGKPQHLDHERYFIRDGIVIVPRNGLIPRGTVI